MLLELCWGNIVMKQEANDEIVADAEENWFDGDMFDEEPDMDVMVEFLKLRSTTALELTKLVLEHCKIEKLTKNDIFKIFHDAVRLTEAMGDVDTSVKGK